MIRIHCSYHKCLTKYFINVMHNVYNRSHTVTWKYQHFNSLIDEFYRHFARLTVSSINNHALDLARLGDDARITRFIRDPRDLIVSGYFYHRRGAEAWCNGSNPKKKDWQVVNGCVPSGMDHDQSFSSYLQNVSREKGLLAELEFRTSHFESMVEWPLDDARIRIFRYEDIIGHEREVFSSIFSHYALPAADAAIAMYCAEELSANRRAKDTAHIRNPVPGQWRQYFTPKVNEHFQDRYRHLLDLYGYD